MSTLDPTLEPKATTVRRLEVITGAGGRRRWSEDDKARIVEETLAAGAVVSEIARRNGATPQQVFTWRRLARDRAEECASGGQSFAPVLIEAPSAPRAKVAGDPIEIIVGEVIVRVPTGADVATLKVVLKIVKASS